MGDADDSGFIWLSEDDLRSATDEELVEEILALQRHVRSLEDDVEDLEELVYLLLDIQVGIGEEFHPNLYASFDTRTDGTEPVEATVDEESTADPDG